MKAIPYLCHHTEYKGRTECSSPQTECCTGCVLSHDAKHITRIDQLMPKVQRAWKARWAAGYGPTITRV